jgi:hypothetical protein
MAAIVTRTRLNSVGHPKQRQGMRFFRPALADALLYVAGRNRAI